MKFAKFLKTPFFTDHILWLAETKHIHASAADLLHIRLGNLDWNESHEKETKHIHASAADLLYIRIRNPDWCKWGHCKNEAREIDYLCCREVDAMLIASAKIPEREGSISPSRFYRQLPDC